MIIYYISLFAIPYHFFFIFSALVALGIHKALYWPGYHADFARFGTDGQRGREVSNFLLLSAFLTIIGPVAGGLIITFFGFKTLFIVVSILILLSNVPLLLTPEKFEPVDFSYTRAFKDLFRKEKMRKFFGYFGLGEEMIAGAVWPLFIYLVVKEYDKLGFLISASVFIGIISALFVGRVVDKKGSVSLIRLGTIITSFCWFLRIFVAGVYSIFLIDSIYRISRKAIGIPMATVTYDDAKKSSIMRSVVFREMALSVGKIFTALCGIIILSFSPIEKSWDALFILAAIMTVFYGFFKKDLDQDIFAHKK